MKEKFIVTSDRATADALSLNGYVKIQSGNEKLFTFINDQSLKFDQSIDLSKVRFSNMLYI